MKTIPELSFQQTLPGCVNVRHIFPILTNRRDELKNFLTSKGIQTLIHYPYPIQRHPALAPDKMKVNQAIIAEEVCLKELSMPLFPGLQTEEVDYICDTIANFFN